MPDTFDADKITDGLFADPNGPHWEETRDALLAAYAAGAGDMRERAAALFEGWRPLRLLAALPKYKRTGVAIDLEIMSDRLRGWQERIHGLPLTPEPKEEGAPTDETPGT